MSEVRKRPLTNAEKQQRFRARKDARAKQLQRWVEYIEDRVGEKKVAQWRLEFLAQDELRETD